MASATARWYFDFVSPFAYLQWRRLRTLPAGAGIEPVPILLGAVLEALGQRGPAEIPRKREATYRLVAWQARREGVTLRFPPAHPFNPLAALRLCIAAGTTPAAIDSLFDWIWRDGHAGGNVAALAPVRERLGVAEAEATGEAAKARLRANTEHAIAAGVFGVPTLAIGDALFWGNDAHDLAMAVLRDPALLDAPDMQHIAQLPIGVSRAGTRAG